MTKDELFYLLMESYKKADFDALIPHLSQHIIRTNDFYPSIFGLEDFKAYLKVKEDHCRVKYHYVKAARTLKSHKQSVNTNFQVRDKERVLLIYDNFYDKTLTMVYLILNKHQKITQFKILDPDTIPYVIDEDFNRKFEKDSLNYNDMLEYLKFEVYKNLMDEGYQVTMNPNPFPSIPHLHFINSINERVAVLVSPSIYPYRNMTQDEVIKECFKKFEIDRILIMDYQFISTNHIQHRIAKNQFEIKLFREAMFYPEVFGLESKGKINNHGRQNRYQPRTLH
jgi:hypothetical protein